MSLLKDKIELGIQEAELGTQQALSRIPALLRWLLILAVLGTFPAYLIAKNVSKKIWLSRLQQGALTAKPSFTNPLPPKISPVSVVTLGTGVYAAVVEVSNENLDLSADQVLYEFSFYNSQKQKVSSFSGKLYLLPNQKKYIGAPTFRTSEAITYANFDLPPDISWQKRLFIPSVKLIAQTPKYYQQTLPSAFVVEGDFSNQSPYTLNRVQLTFVLFNTAGKIIGVSQREESTVAPFERRAYKQLWPDTFAADLNNVKVTANTNVLDPNNIISESAPQTAPGPASDLNRPTPKNYYSP
jgi:hypothetical protein